MKSGLLIVVEISELLKNFAGVRLRGSHEIRFFNYLD